MKDLDKMFEELDLVKKEKLNRSKARRKVKEISKKYKEAMTETWFSYLNCCWWEE